MTSSHPTSAPCQRFSWLASALDRRSALRLALLFLGAVLARGRRTVTTWIRAAKLGNQFRPYYIAVAAADKRSDRIARRLLTDIVAPLVAADGRLTLALDDTPTKRYGPHVQERALITTQPPARPPSSRKRPRPSGRSARSSSSPAKSYFAEHSLCGKCKENVHHTTPLRGGGGDVR